MIDGLDRDVSKQKRLLQIQTQIDISNKRDKENKYSEKIMEFALCLLKRMMKKLIAFCFERDKCFVFQTLAFLLQRPLIFIELKPLVEQAN